MQQRDNLWVLYLQTEERRKQTYCCLGTICDSILGFFLAVCACPDYTVNAKASCALCYFCLYIFILRLDLSCLFFVASISHQYVDVSDACTISACNPVLLPVFVCFGPIDVWGQLHGVNPKTAHVCSD